MNGSESERLASSLVPSMSIVQVAKERKREGEREIKREGVEESKKEKEREKEGVGEGKEKGKESIQYMLNKVFAEISRNCTCTLSTVFSQLDDIQT